MPGNKGLDASKPVKPANHAASHAAIMLGNKWLDAFKLVKPAKAIKYLPAHKATKGKGGRNNGGTNAADQTLGFEEDAWC